MKIVVFTSSFKRHKYLIKKLSNKFEKVIYICETKPLIRSKVTTKKKLYFKKVSQAEKLIFKKVQLKNRNIIIINFDYGKIQLSQLIKLKDFKTADKFLVFGSSYIKGKLFKFLKKNKTLNIHMGVMPYYRGTDCNFWAINDRNFDKVGGTLMLLSKKIDDGRVLSIFHMNESIRNNLFNYSMRACKLSINHFIDHVLKNKKNKFIKINKSKLIRYSKKENFDDQSIEKFYLIQKKTKKNSN